MQDAERWKKEELEAVAVVVSAISPILRAGLHTMLGEIDEAEVVAVTGDITEARALLTDTQVLILGPGAGAPEELTAVLEDLPGLAILLLVEEGFPNRALANYLSLMHGRAWGVLSLEASSEELAAAVHALSEGLMVGAPLLVDEPVLLDTSAPPHLEEEQLIETLTEREVEVLQLLAQGLANKQIALALGISEHTVKYHISGLYSKLGATNRTEAVRLGVRRGLVVL
jgi:DNA-binding NarL/FixJ family response regulator